MAKQLVLSGNQVIAHGEDCFLAMGGTVICPESGRVYQNATVANIEGGIPADIDEVGYEYHAGEFVPCAPYGKGSGNVAVVCNDDCKSIKDSGISSENLGGMFVVDYVGTGTNSVTVSAPFPPRFAVVVGTDLAAAYTKRVGIITPYGGMSWYLYENASKTDTFENTFSWLKTSASGNKISWTCTYHGTGAYPWAFNYKNDKYRVYLFGRA